MNPCLIFNQTTGKDETSDTDNSLVHDLNKVKVEQEDFHDFCINLTNKNEDAFNNFESFKYFDKSTENRTG